MTTQPPFNGKVFLIVTGASKGIGRQIVFDFSNLLEEGSRVLLLARNEKALEEVSHEIPKHVTVAYENVDLACASFEQLTKIVKNSLGEDGISGYDHAVIVHNAGSVGDISEEAKNVTDMDKLRKYFDLNVFSPAILNNVFMKLLETHKNVDKLVINITSLCAIKPMKSVVYYSCGKAAREMFFKAFALENPDVKVLNYAPGPVQTDMLQTICDDAGDAEVREQFQHMQEHKQVLTPEQTVERLIRILTENKFKSGDHVDYFDE